MSEIAKLSAKIMTYYTVVNRSENHEWLSDEPEEHGGKDQGPKPTEIFLSSLASCILITIRMYAQRKEWNVGEIQIDLTMKSLEKGVEIIKNIRFSGILEPEQTKRLLEISNRCPVANIISNPVEFKFS